MNNPAAAFYVHHDFNPALAGSGAVQYEEAGAAAQITFDGVYNADTTTPGGNHFQFQIDFATGVVVVAIGAMTVDSRTYLVGYSPGGASKNPGPTDLSALAGPVLLGSADLLQPALSPASRPVMGTNWTTRCHEVPSTTAFGAVFSGLADPGILDLGFLGMPTCQLRSTLDLIGGFLPVAGTHVYSLAIPAAPPSLIGIELFTQVATFDLVPVNAFGAITSNGLKGVVQPF